MYEPLFSEVAQRNLRVNGLPDDVEPYAVGIAGELCAPSLEKLGATSLRPMDEAGPSVVCVKGKPWELVLDKDYDLVKVDCEGCEEHLAETPCEALRKGHKWIVEVHEKAHGVSPSALSAKLRSCDFEVLIAADIWADPVLYATLK